MKSLAAGLGTAAIVFAGTYLLNEAVWGFIPFGSSLAWAVGMAAVAFVIGYQAEHRGHLNL